MQKKETAKKLVEEISQHSKKAIQQLISELQKEFADNVRQVLLRRSVWLLDQTKIPPAPIRFMRKISDQPDDIFLDKIAIIAENALKTPDLYPADTKEFLSIIADADKIKLCKNIQDFELIYETIMDKIHHQVAALPPLLQIEDFVAVNDSLGIVDEPFSVSSTVSSLLEALKDGSLEQIKEVFPEGCDVNKPITNYTPLCIAVRENRLEVAKYLVSIHAQANSPADSKLVPPLFVAINKGYIAMTKFLIEEADANIHATFNGITAEALAYQKNNPAIVKIIEDKKRSADIQAVQKPRP